ncbi:uncharacterized protein A1O9_08783 [Exophiala aquamarina CBS 119918]|uniref:Uncharacterized protein n=1 Tax=Exophiala aquamarina CBS 119918 TaxID=1182545 RepID=A0A072PHX2_9EURO|nr:uncharacterized protein A1O9_08783 [Exophiala aquamarina CBS 119918]KEF55130.1 hypothetical protein A1O9_08783 [Exophiala aquamarina CBS 119918]
MAPMRRPAAYAPLPVGYAWATDIAAETSDSESSVSSNPSKSVARDVPSLRLNSSLVFHMAEPQAWVQLSPQAKLQKKREHLCAQWGEENFTFFEDAPAVRKHRGRIQVRRYDYYAHFEVWDAEHFNVQYHNSMTLLQDGLKMNDDDFNRLQSSLGIVDAEFLHAFNDWKCHCGSLEVQAGKQPPKTRAVALAKRPPTPPALPKSLLKQRARPCESALGNRQSPNATLGAPRPPQLPPDPQQYHGPSAALNYPQVFPSKRPAPHAPSNSPQAVTTAPTSHAPGTPQQPQESRAPHAPLNRPQVHSAAQRVQNPNPRNSADAVVSIHLADVTSSRRNRLLANNAPKSQLQPTGLSMASPTQSKRIKRDFSEVDDSTQQYNLHQYNYQQRSSLPQNFQWPNKRTRTEVPRRKKIPLFLRREASRTVTLPGFRETPRRLCDPEMYGQGLKENQHKFADEHESWLVELDTVFTHVETSAEPLAKDEEEANVIVRRTLAELFRVIKNRFSYEQELREFDDASSILFYGHIYNLWSKGVGLADPYVVWAIAQTFKVGDQAISEKETQVLRNEMLQYVHNNYFAQWWQMVVYAIITSRKA